MRALPLAALLLLGVGCDSRNAHPPPRPAHVARMAFATKDHRIWITDLNARHRRFLVRGTQPLLSPDGHWVAFQRDQGCASLTCLLVVNADGGPVRTIASRVTWVAWAPDSRHLAIARIRKAPHYDYELVTADRSIGPPLHVVTAPVVRGFAFSPDSRRIAFAFGRGRTSYATDLYVADLNGRERRRLTRDASSSEPVWAPDGWIDFSHVEGRRQRLWRIRRDGSGRGVFTRGPAPVLPAGTTGITALAWSANGKTLLAASPAGEFGQTVVVVDHAGRVHRLAAGASPNAGDALAISRDGRFALVWDQLDGPDSARTVVKLVPTDGGRVRVLARGPIDQPSWSR